jgi:type II secretory pathway pseudopilin PulG
MYCAYCGTEVATLSANCPACGKPASGAPAPTGKGTSAAAVVAIVVGVGLMFVFIVGIIAAIAIPNLLSAINRGRQKRTMYSINVVATASEAYAIDHGFYPEASSMEDLAALLEPTYVAVLPRTDGWEHPLSYRCWQEDPTFEGCDSYAVVSPGRDGILDFPDLRGYPEQEIRTTDFDQDIVFRNGDFTQYPDNL